MLLAAGEHAFGPESLSLVRHRLGTQDRSHSVAKTSESISIYLRNTMKKSLSPLFYFLIALYPLISLWAFNVTEIWPKDVLRAALVTLGAISLLYLLLRVLWRDSDKAALLGSCYAILFFSYGHLYDLVRHAGAISSLGRHRYLLPAFLLIGIGAAFLIMRLRKRAWLRWLNLAAVILIILPIGRIGSFYLASAYASSRLTTEQPQSSLVAAPSESLPDVYLIVLDGYMRADAMKQDLDFDNGDFINGLEALGFYVADCSRPNYPYTLGSLAAVLNMDYIPTLKEKHQDITGSAFWNIIRVIAQ